MPDTVLQRFEKFKTMFISSDIPNNVLLELIESYIKSDTEDMPVEEIATLDGQLSLFDLTA